MICLESIFFGPQNFFSPNFSFPFSPVFPAQKSDLKHSTYIAYGLEDLGCNLLRKVCNFVTSQKSFEIFCI